MKKIIIILGLGLSMTSMAQTLHVQGGATLYIDEAAAIDGSASVSTPTLFVGGDILNIGTITNNGELQLTGNLNNFSTYLSAGDDVFSGASNQDVVGFTGANALYNMVVNNNGANVNLTGNLDVNNGITLSNGVIVPGANTLHLKSASPTALASTAASGSMNNYINGSLRQDVATGTYTYYTGDATHGNQKASITFSSTGSATYMDVSYSSATAGPTSLLACGGTLYDKKSGTWTLTPNGVNGTYLYNITLDPGGSNLASIMPSFYDGILKDGLFITDPCAQISGNNTVTGLNSFSTFAKVSTGNVALPVQLISFDGQKVGNVDVLRWTTASENNNAYFNLQYSTDGSTFKTIGTINSLATGGTSTQNLDYSFTNEKPVLGHNYYRLEQVDIDNKNVYHAHIVDLLRASSLGTVSIYPNPTNNILNIDMESTHVHSSQIKLSDMSGRTVKEVRFNSQIGLNHTQINLDDIASGVYSLSIYDNGNLSFIQKINKID